MNVTHPNLKTQSLCKSASTNYCLLPNHSHEE